MTDTSIVVVVHMYLTYLMMNNITANTNTNNRVEYMTSNVTSIATFSVGVPSGVSAMAQTKHVTPQAKLTTTLNAKAPSSVETMGHTDNASAIQNEMRIISKSKWKPDKNNRFDVEENRPYALKDFIQRARLNTTRTGNQVQTKLKMPYADQVVDDEENECKIELCEKCISLFRHTVFYSQSNFVYLKLVPSPSSGISITGGEDIVGEHLWVWTFYGKEGGMQFLNWPIEFGIWSMGLLTSFVTTKPVTMELSRISGNCSNLEVGRVKDNEIISNALLNLTLTMMTLSKDKYAPSFFCYKSRKYIQPRFVYTLCKHMICPLEALKYTCCNYYYSITFLNRSIDCRQCPGKVFEYETVGWVLPTVVSVLLFIYCPLILLYVAHLVIDNDEHSCTMIVTNMAEDIGGDTVSDKVILLNEHHHVTLFKTLFLPIQQLVKSITSSAPLSCQVVLKRLVRCFLPFLSLVVIGLQICLDYWFLHSFVLTSIVKGVPMGFRSLIAGYEESKGNFLPYLGGPYIAIGVYLLITCILILLPESLSSMLISGLPGNDVDDNKSPLCISLRSIEKFGCVRGARRQNYLKLYNVFLAQFYMFINVRFWKRMIVVQIERWRCFCRMKLCLVFMPLYIAVCIIELLMCVGLYGLPIVSFGVTIMKAYSGLLTSAGERRNVFVKFLFGLFRIVLIAFVLYFLFMFSTVFMDATLFLTRVVIFTFTGVVVYPKISYGYIIFTLTVVFYIWQSFLEVSRVYHDLLKDIIGVCGTLHRGNDSDHIVVKMGDFKGIRESLFEYVIEKHCPRRKQVFVSLLKVAIILTVLGLLLNILIEIDGFRDLHVITHVATTLFICAMPQIVKILCRGPGYEYRHRRSRRELTSTIVTYIGYTYESSEGADGSSELD